MKAILVIDIGNDEYLLNKEIDTICFKDGDKIYDNFNFLKPLPRKLDANDWHRMFSGIFSEREAKGYGWNACIDEILGDNDE